MKAVRLRKQVDEEDWTGQVMGKKEKTEEKRS